MNVFEQVNDMVVLDLDISGFEDLSEKQKKLSYHLSKAALWGNYISFVQGSKYNLMFLSDLKEVYQSEKIKEFPSFQQEIKSILFTLFFHGGVYHSTTGEKIDFNFSDSLKVFLDTHFQSFTHKLSFLNEMKQYRTVQNDEVDIVAESGGNHYQNLTTEEVKEYRKTAYNTELFGEKQPMFGLNEVLVKNQQTGEIVSHKIYKDGLYGKYIVKIVDELEKAIEFSENEKQKNSIKSLITFYKSGDVTDFDKHAIDWVENS